MQLLFITQLCLFCLPKLNGKALTDAILSYVKSQNLPLEKIIGQGYDRASSMSGKEIGVQAVVVESCPQTVYIRCSAHVMN